MNDKDNAMTPGQAVKTYEAIGKIGDEAWRKWVDLGYFVLERTTAAATKARGTRGPTYSAHLEKQLGKFAPIYRKLSNNGTLTSLVKCMGKLDEVNAFRERTRKSENASEPPSHPQRLWAAYEASLSSTIDFQDDAAESDADAEDAEETAKAEGRRGKGHNREKDLLAQITALTEEIARIKEMYEITGDPDSDAQRTWRRLVEAVGHDGAIERWPKFRDKMDAIVRRVSEK